MNLRKKKTNYIEVENFGLVLSVILDCLGF